MSEQPLPDAIKQALMHGDLSGLTPEQQLLLYQQTCASLGLNPLTNPFHYLELKGEGDSKKLVLYATKGCADQLRSLRGITARLVEWHIDHGLCIAHARSEDASGRFDDDLGIVPIGKEGGTWKTSQGGKRYLESDGTFMEFQGEARANAIKKAITQAKRRSTLSFCGLGMLDESEISGIPGAIEVPGPTATEPPLDQPALPPSSAVEVPLTMPKVAEPTLAPAQRTVRPAQSELIQPPAQLQPSLMPIDKMNRQEVLHRIETRLKELYPGDDPTARHDRMTTAQRIWGEGITSLGMLRGSQLSALKRGAEQLMSMVKDAPPDDVPMFDSPESPQETRSEDESVPEALPQGEVVTTGEPDAEETAAEELPPESPRMVGTVVDPGDVGVLVLWAEMNNQRDLLDQLLVGKRMVEGLPVLSLNSYQMIWTKVKAAIAVTVEA